VSLSSDTSRSVDREAVDALGAAAFRCAAVPAALLRVPVAGPPEAIAINGALAKLTDRSEDVAELDVGDLFAGLEETVASSLADAETATVSCPVVVGGVLHPATLHLAQLPVDGSGRTVLVQVTDVAGDRKIERALRESEKRVQDLIDNVSALIYIKSADGRFLLVNRYFEEMFGIDRHEAPSHTNADFFPPEIAAAYSENDREVLQRGVPMEFEEPRYDGGRWLSLKFPLFDVEGNIYAVGGISTDISDRSRAEATILQAKEQAERANQAKSEFLSRMSHELRTPLNSILGFGQLLQMEHLPPGNRESVDRIVKAGRHLLALINEVLEISRLEAQGRPTNVEPLDLCLPLREALELVRPIANERDIHIVEDLHGGLYRPVLADRQRVTQVLLNILSNAIKYNRIGGRVKVSFADSGEDRLRLRVADTGYGMSPEAVEKAFLPFERLGADRTGTEGTGLGLTLSRGLIEAMKGSIGVERSVKDEGTTFYIELPLAPTDSAVQPAVLLPPIEPVGDLSIGAGTILYVEDNLANLDLVNGLFQRVGNVRLIPAVQGQLGVELATRHRPDLVLLDLHLPDLDGEEVLRRLRDDPRTSSIPVIVLSADATREQVDRLVERGAAAYVTKPLDVRVFLRAVRSALGSRGVES
jgi:PAS domain S-box-containing protein